MINLLIVRFDPSISLRQQQQQAHSARDGTRTQYRNLSEPHTTQKKPPESLLSRCAANVRVLNLHELLV